MGTITITAPGDIRNAVTVSSGTGTANLLTPEPREVWVSTSSASFVIYDFGSPQPFDSVFLGFTNARPLSNWTVSTSDDGSSFANVFAARPIVEPIVAYGMDGSIGRRVHLYAKLPAPLTARFVRVALTQPSGSPPVRAGILVVNRCFQPIWPEEFGGGRTIIDTVQRNRLPGGGFSFDDGVIKDAYQCTLGDLSDAELQTLYAMIRRQGERRPVVLVEDP